MFRGHFLEFFLFSLIQIGFIHSFIRFFIVANVKTHLFYNNTDIYCNYVKK